MKILFDECAPWPMHKIFVGHECSAASACGWAGIKNGELLRLAEGLFDVFVTADQNLEFQQNLARSRLGVVILAAPSIALEDLRPLVPAALAAIGRVRAGEVVRVAA